MGRSEQAELKEFERGEHRVLSFKTLTSFAIRE
jgi:hypothetical protein